MARILSSTAWRGRPTPRSTAHASTASRPPRPRSARPGRPAPRSGRSVRAARRPPRRQAACAVVLGVRLPLQAVEDRIRAMSNPHHIRWAELTQLLDIVDRFGLRALTADRVRRLCQLYRQVTIDLSRARAEGDDPVRVQYLNLLAARA